MPVPAVQQLRLSERRCSLGRILVEPEDDAMRIFDKYVSGFARRLKKPEALKMLEVEFELTENEAIMMFSTFDKDENEVMSLWEFRQFYQTIGLQAKSYITLFKKLEKDSSGLIDIEKAFDELQGYECPSGKLTDDEVEMYLRTTAGESREIDLHKFLNMMCRIKIQQNKPKE